MRCPSCRRDVSDHARFCEQCGTRLMAACETCGAAVSIGDRLCGACGAAMASAAPMAPGVADPAERRQVTVMFCDLVDSTGLSGRVDPEELRDVMQGYYEICAREIGRVGGYLARFLGDGVLAYFGYPVAREQDAQAAVLAGLAIVHAVRSAAAVAGTRRLSVRVGIHSGLVVAGEVIAADRRELFVVGSTPNVAARLQAEATPDSVVISDATHRLVGTFFDCVDLGERAIKGVAGAVRLWEPHGESGVHSRVEAPGVKLTPLVGREAELADLRASWRRAASGEGMTVLVSGEAGIGKSRLLHELKAELSEQPHLRLDCRCSPHHESSALFPIVDLLQRMWGFRRGDSAAERLARLEEATAPYAAEVPDVVGLLASLMSVPLPARDPALELTPQARKQRTLDALVAIILRATRVQPLLFAVEDLHWADPSTLELLARVVEQVPAARLMALFLFRPTFSAPWRASERVRRIDLQRLSADETTAMMQRVAGRLALPAAVVRNLLARVDGVPLYVEELTTMVLESGALRARKGRWEFVASRSALPVPATLHESLMARLDRLVPDREVLALGATIGRAFSHELIRAVSDLDDVTLTAELERLVDSGILSREGTPPEATYVFKHALIQDAACGMLLKNRLREHHLRIAETLERRFPDVVETQPELLGHHWASAGRAREAIDHLLRAGRYAYERSADEEAATHLRRGLALLDGVADAAARADRELALLLALGPVLVGTLGYSNPEVEEVYARARRLCEQVGGDERLRFAVLGGLLLFHQSRAELATCVELTGQRLALAQALGDPSLEMLAHENAGTLAYWRGDLAHALTSLREALARYTPERGRALRLVYGTDTAVVCTTYESHVLFLLGRPAQALRTATEALAIARELGHVHSLVLALAFAAWLHRLRGEFADAARLLDEAHVLAAEQHLAQWIGTCAVGRADVLVAHGRAEEAIAGFFAGLAAFQATGATIAGRYFAERLAEAYLAAGRADEGLVALDSLLETLARCEDVFYDSEVCRVRGRLLLAAAPDDPDAAERCFRDALALARRFGALSFELRAATSLAELWARHGRSADAHRLLGGVYERFSEGFDTADVREAAALLASLESPSASRGLTARTSA